MNRNKKNMIAALVLLIAAAAAVWVVLPSAYRAQILAGLHLGKQPAAVGGNPGVPHSRFKLPSGTTPFQVVEAAGAEPAIIQGVIDPLDVHVGDRQTLSLVVQDPVEIVSVTAFIRTDHSTTTLPLNLVGEVAASEIMPARYAVDSGNHLAFVNPPPSMADNPKPSFSGSFASFLDSLVRTTRYVLNTSSNSASAAEPPKLKYEASWTVLDTHNATYHTTFAVKDKAGRENSLTMAWSDACGIPNTGSWNLNTNGNCTITSPDGVDNGTSTISTYTLTLASTFAYNPGQSIVVSGGGIISLVAGGIIQKTYLWKQDQDADGYPDPLNKAQDTSPGVGWARKYTYGSLADDCADNDANTNPGQTAYFTTSGGNGFDYNCDGIQAQEWPLLNVCSTAGQTACQNGSADGWGSSVPACGVSSDWATCSWTAGVGCGAIGTSRTQACV